MKLIDKDALVAEIERLIERAKAERVLYPKTILAAKNYLLIEDYKKLLFFLDTLEVKEVGLDFTKEVDVWIRDNGDTNGFFNVEELAKYFFELGMAVSNKTQKGEEV